MQSRTRGERLVDAVVGIAVLLSCAPLVAVLPAARGCPVLALLFAIFYLFRLWRWLPWESAFVRQEAHWYADAKQRHCGVKADSASSILTTEVEMTAHRPSPRLGAANDAFCLPLPLLPTPSDQHRSGRRQLHDQHRHRHPYQHLYPYQHRIRHGVERSSRESARQFLSLSHQRETALPERQLEMAERRGRLCHPRYERHAGGAGGYGEEERSSSPGGFSPLNSDGAGVSLPPLRVLSSSADRQISASIEEDSMPEMPRTARPSLFSETRR